MHIRLRVLALTISLFTGILLPTNQVEAFEYSTDLGGGGYQEVRAAPHLAPAVALAAVALAAIIAVSLQTQNNPTHVHLAPL